MNRPADLAEETVVAGENANRGVAPKDRGALYRVDKFMVPVAGRDEFLARVRDTHAVLRRQAGFRQDMILEQQSGPGALNIVTIVEWENAAVVDRVAAAVAARHAEIGFDRNEMMLRLGITADIANYGRVPDA